MIAILVIVCAVLAALIITGVYAGNFAAYRHMNLNRFLKKQLDPSDEEMNQGYMTCAEAMRDRVTAEYDITGCRGVRLHGYLIAGDPESNVYVLCSHGYRDPYGGFEFAEKAPIWQSRGYHLFFVDHRAHAQSEGNFLSFGQYESEDCIRWIAFMKQEFGPDIRVILHGQSMGGATVLQMSGKPNLPDNVKLIVADCGYTSFYEQCKGLLPIPKWLEAIVLTCANLYLISCHRINMKRADSLAAVRHASVPILFIQGERDTFVPVRMCHEMYEACTSADKEIEIFPEATHCTSYAYDPERYTRVVLTFTDKHLEKR